MTQPFAFEKTVDAEETSITIRGTIDEDANLLDCLKGVTRKVRVDLMGVDRITSTGAREWINAIKELPDNAEVTFTRCSVAVVEQANLVNDFLAAGRVVSFLAPYYSETENKEYTLLIDVDKCFPAAAPLVAPDFRGAENVPEDLEFDDDEEEYFLFLDLQRRREKSAESGRYRPAQHN